MNDLGTNWSSRHPEREAIEREILDFDVLYIGGGPANLISLWHLLNQIEEAKKEGKTLPSLTIGLIEKGDQIGDHIFSGAVLDPQALEEAMPDYLERGFPTEGRVQREEVWLLTSDRQGVRAPIVPPFLHNIGHHIISLSKVCRWLASEIEKRSIEGVDVMILPGFSAMKVLWEKETSGVLRVKGVQTTDKGVDRDGNPKSNFEPGNYLHAKITIFGEGPRGHLSRELEEVLHLQSTSVNPQVYEMGVKEIWEVPDGNIEEGFVLHSTGWPLPEGEIGGSWVYALGKNKVSIGYVVSLDSRDPFVDGHAVLQAFKKHPKIAPFLDGGKMIQYGGKALAIGGWYSMPQLAFPGGMLVGDAAQMVNAARLKGIHLAMKGGMCAAETIASCLLVNDFSSPQLETYPQRFMNSGAGAELYTSRNFHGIVQHGLTPSALTKLNVALLANGWVPGDPLRVHADALQTESTEKYYGKKGLKYGDVRDLIKSEGLQFSKLDDVYVSGTQHDEHQPCHLKIVKGNEVCVECYEEKGAPCTVFCPAQVYEMHPDASGHVKQVDIAFSNCVHCKTCDIKCPEENVIWTPPEGGGGPKYTLC